MGLPLVLLNRRRQGGALFTPSRLFALAEPGVWYDTSDLTTLFQDTAGTTPVTTPGQTVALALDESRGAVGTNGASRRNLLTFTEQFDNAAWTTSVSGGGVSVSVTPNAATDPLGGNTADRIQASKTGTATSDVAVVRNAATIFASYTGDATYSIWLRSNTGSSQSVWFAGTGAAPNVVTVTTSWQRFTFTRAASAETLQFSFNIGARGTSDNTVDVLAWGAQLETGSTATTYQRITADWPSTMAGIHAIQSASSGFRPAYQVTPRRFNFDGSDDRLNFAYNPTTSGSLAVRINGATASRVAIGSQGATDGRCFIGLASDGALAGGIGTQTTATIKGSTDIRSTWTTGILTWDGTTVRLYQDGTEVYSGAQSGAVNTTVPFDLGCLNNNGTRAAFWSGGIGAAIALGRVMTPAEVSSLHQFWSNIA